MKFPHLFECVDQAWLPHTLRGVEREILEFVRSEPFRPFNRLCADLTLETAREAGLTTIVEAGAGTAPITRVMAEDPRSQGMRFIISDLNPDPDTWRELQQQHPEKIFPIYEPVDLSVPSRQEPKTLLLVCGTFHHMPPVLHERILKNMGDADAVIVIEPLRKTLLSLFFCLFSFFPVLLLPLVYWNRPGKFKRFLWCWFFPVAIPIFTWDGMVSSLRMYTDGEWKAILTKIFGPSRRIITRHFLFTGYVYYGLPSNPAKVVENYEGVYRDKGEVLHQGLIAQYPLLKAINIIVVVTVLCMILVVREWGGFSFFNDPWRVGIILVLSNMAFFGAFSKISGLFGSYRVNLKDWWTLPATSLLSLGTAWLSPWSLRHNFWTIPWNALYLGLALFIVGSALRFHAAAILGHRFSPFVALQKNHELETRGIFHVIRHPSYLGGILMFAGWGLFFRSWIGLGFTLLISLVVLARIKTEEAFLHHEFGRAYEAYCARTWKLFPYVY